SSQDGVTCATTARDRPGSSALGITRSSPEDCAQAAENNAIDETWCTGIHKPSPEHKPSSAFSGSKAICQLAAERTTIFGAPVVPDVSAAQAAAAGSSCCSTSSAIGARESTISGTSPSA